MPRILARLALAFLLIAAGSTLAPGRDWPAFRGGLGNAVNDDADYPTEWSPDENIAWRVELPGTGNGSPIVSNGRVFVTAAEEDGAKRTLYCFDRKDGKQLWAETIAWKENEKTHDTNLYAGTTPAADGERVVVFHGSAGLHCYDFTGKTLWSRNDLGEVTHFWGYGTSPIIYNDRVYLNFGPTNDTCLLCVELKTGKTVWRTEEPEEAGKPRNRLVGSWSTPVVANVNGTDQLICSMPTRVVAYDLAKGDILWTVGGLPSSRGDLVYTSTVVFNDLGVAMAGYKGPAIGFKLGGSGDMTEKNRLWQTDDNQPQRIGSGVILGDHFYIANAGPSTAQCLDLKTGKELWTARLSGGDHWASTVMAGNLLYATSQSSTVTVFKPSPEKFERVAVNSLKEPTNATPAFSQGQIFLRTVGSLYCIGELK